MLVGSTAMVGDADDVGDCDVEGAMVGNTDDVGNNDVEGATVGKADVVDVAVGNAVGTWEEFLVGSMVGKVVDLRLGRVVGVEVGVVVGKGVGAIVGDEVSTSTKISLSGEAEGGWVLRKILSVGASVSTGFTMLLLLLWLDVIKYPTMALMPVTAKSRKAEHPTKSHCLRRA